MLGIKSKTPDSNLQVFVHFLGANNGVVTGSATIVTIKRNGETKNILVDYGWFQGVDEEMNSERVISGDEIDCVLLTHAHLDHCGGIPALFRAIDGDVPYLGKIYGSRETLEQAVHILRDSAKLNENKIKDIKYGMKRAKNSLNKDKIKALHDGAKPCDIASIDSAVEVIKDEENIIFDSDDVEEAIKHFVPVDVKVYGNEEISLFEGIDAKFIPTPHINGSCMIELRAHYGEEEYTIVFSGDIGKEDTILYRKMNFPNNFKANAIVLESLHGDEREEETLNESVLMLKKHIKKAIKKQKTVIIPVFAMDRSASIIKVLNDFMDQGLYLQCFVDSPLAMKEFGCYVDSYNNGSSWFSYHNGYPFKLDRFTVIKEYQEHLIASKYKGPNIFITSSLMGYGGRVLDYFEHHIQDEDSVFIFPGFMPNECPSKALLDAKKGEIVEINDKRYIKQCETIWLHGFSSHGYADDKFRVISSYPNATKVFLNHGDEGSLIGTYSDVFEYNKNYESVEREIIIPAFDDIYRLY